jgi:hypothetical protein
MKTKIIPVLLLSLLAASCVSDYNASLPASDMELIYIDGTIIANTTSTFYITKGFPLNDNPFSSYIEDIYVYNATLTLIGDDGYQSQPAIYQAGGAYLLPVGDLDDNVAYGIRIECDGEVYQSELAPPLRTPPIDSVSWRQNEVFGPVSFHISTHDDTDKAHFFAWNYTEDWEIYALYPTTIFYDPEVDTCYIDESHPYLYCWKSDISSQFLAGSTESLRESRIINRKIFEYPSGDDRFSVVYSVMVYQRATSKAAYEYNQSVDRLNTEMGGLFTPQPSELTGNITCTTDPSKRVMGYVEAVQNVTSYRLFLRSGQLRRIPLFGYSNCDTRDGETGGLPIPAEYGIFYRAGYRPAEVEYDIHGNFHPSIWALQTCTDCRARGGNKNKPSFWPNEHQ